MSSKNTCDSYHTFFIRFFLKDRQSNKLVYIGSSKSPRFQLFSRHRIRMLQKLNGATKDQIVTDGQHLATTVYTPKQAPNALLTAGQQPDKLQAPSSQTSRERKRRKPSASSKNHEHDLLLHQLRAGETPSAFSPKEKTALRRKLDQIIDRSKPPKKRLRVPAGDHGWYGASSLLQEAHLKEAIKELQDKNVYTAITRLVTFLVFFADGGGGGASASGGETLGARIHEIDQLQPRSRKDSIISRRDSTISLGLGRPGSEDGLEEFSAYLLQDVLGTMLPNEFFECGYESGTRSIGDVQTEVKSEPGSESKQSSSEGYSGFDALKQAVKETGKTCTSRRIQARWERPRLESVEFSV